jgi:hypothetical protein
MCTALIHNGERTIVGWNLDIIGMEYRVVPSSTGVYIEIKDKTEGWMPLFGANSRGDFVAMPTCWPYDARSDASKDSINIINLDIDLLTSKRTFDETRKLLSSTDINSVPGLTFQAQLSDKNGNVLQITPGQGVNYLIKPEYSVMTNFSPYKGAREKHPWMGLDRYETAVKMLESADSAFGVSECFAVLKAVSQTVCPTVVSMVYDVNENTVWWCENREWESVKSQKLVTKEGKTA